MSFIAMDWARTAPVANATERAILWEMAEAASDDGRGAFRAKATLARTAVCHTDTVRATLRNLEKRGLIAKGDQEAARYIPSNRRPVVYDLLIPHRWYSEDRLAKLNEDRANIGLPPLAADERPAIAPAERRTHTRRDDAPGEDSEGPGEAPDGDLGGAVEPSEAFLDDDLADGPVPMTENAPAEPVDNSAAEAVTGDDTPGGGISAPRNSGGHGNLGAEYPPPRGRNIRTPGGGISAPNLSLEPVQEPPLRAGAREAAPPAPGGETPIGEMSERQRAVSDWLSGLNTRGRPWTAKTTRRERAGIVDAVIAVEDLGVERASIRADLEADLGNARRIASVWSSRLTTLIESGAENAADAPSARLPRVCGDCDARDGEAVHWRVVHADPSDPGSAVEPCPRCNPHAPGYTPPAPEGSTEPSSETEVA